SKFNSRDSWPKVALLFLMAEQHEKDAENAVPSARYEEVCHFIIYLLEGYNPDDDNRALLQEIEKLLRENMSGYRIKLIENMFIFVFAKFRIITLSQKTSIMERTWKSQDQLLEASANYIKNAGRDNFASNKLAS